MKFVTKNQLWVFSNYSRYSWCEVIQKIIFIKFLIKKKSLKRFRINCFKQNLKVLWKYLIFHMYNYFEKNALLFSIKSWKTDKGLLEKCTSKFSDFNQKRNCPSKCIIRLENFIDLVLFVFELSWKRMYVLKTWISAKIFNFFFHLLYFLILLKKVKIITSYY